MNNKTNIKTSLTIFVFLLVMMVLLAGATSVYGRTPTILLVSDCSAPGAYTGTPPYDVNEQDNTLVLFLEGLGYTVDTSGMNKAYQEGQNPFGDPTKVAALNAANLVLVSRHTNSVGYDNDRQKWNELEKPLLLMNGYLTRGGSDNRWGWTTGGGSDALLWEMYIYIEAGQETHPFVAGFTSPIAAFDWSSAPTLGQAPKPVFLPNSPPVAGATVIGTFDSNSILIDVPAGTDFDANNASGPYGIAGGQRVLLGTWGYDIYLEPFGRDATFTDFLTEEYLALFAQTLNELIPSPNETIYVDADAVTSADGRSWPSAFRYLQDALTIAWPGDEIRVAEGIYKPDANSTVPSGSGDRGENFQLIDGVTIKGGYAGFGEPDPDARDIEAYETILSGDIGTVDDNTDNSYHVVTCIGTDVTATLDGFTITGGNANGPFPHDSGTGMYNNNSSPTVTNCTFSGNIAAYGGGGMGNVSSSPTVTDCNFSGNTALYGGAGMGNVSSSPTVTDCNFSGNTALYGGAGMGNVSSSPTVTNCNFSGNSADYGGGMYNWDSSSPTVTNCTFSGNEAAIYGGGMYNYGSGPTVANCSFSQNTAGTNGGGIYNTSSSPTIINCTISGNTVTSNGGGMFNDSGSPTVINCAFSGNTAGVSGGGMRNWTSSPTVTNCTFTDNSANYGGGMYNANGSNPNVTNCILWGNSPDEIDNNASTPNVTYCDVQGSGTGLGNIDADPLFVDANNPDPNLWSFRIQPDSPCIDAGDTTVVSLPLDLDGYPRAIDYPHTPNTGRSVSASLNVVDMGAYEFQPCRIAGDNNCDGVVDFKDLAILAGNWLAGVGN